MGVYFNETFTIYSNNNYDRISFGELMKKLLDDFGDDGVVFWMLIGLFTIVFIYNIIWC